MFSVSQVFWQQLMYRGRFVWDVMLPNNRKLLTTH